MPRRLVSIGLAGAFATSALTCSLFDSKDEKRAIEEYWPLKIGNSWTLNSYQSDHTVDATFTYRVVGTQSEWSELEVASAGAYAYTDTVLMRVSEGEMVMHEDEADEGQVLLREPLKRGTTWTEANGLAMQLVISNLDSSVTVPAGTFDGVLVVQGVYPSDPNYRRRWCYAPRVGPLSTAWYQYAGGQWNYGGSVELVSYTVE